MYQRSFTALFSFLFLLAFFLPGTSSARWQWANPLPQGETLRGLAFNGSDAYVAVGTNGTLLVSADTTNWAPVYVSFRSTLNAVIWSNGLFVAVGDDGVILTSVDGREWTRRSSPSPQILNAVAWSGSVFVAVGKAGVLLSSLDGIDWTARESGTSNDLNDVVWGNNQLVAVGANTTLLTSGDGVTWISRSTNQEAGNLAAIVWTGTRYLVANNNYYGNIYSSNDAIAWTRVYRDPAMSLRDIVWTSSGFFVTTSRTNIVYSATGAPNSWGAYYSRTEQALYGLVWDGSKVLAAGSGGTILAIRGSLSVNPNVSNVASTGMQEDLTAIVWGGDQFVAVGNNTAGGSTVMTSPDGVAWTPRNAGAVSELSGVIWSGAGYLAYSRSKILLSADGVGWESVTTLPYLNQVVWAGDKFVALFDDPATGANIAVSSDGRSWDSYQSGFSETLRSITWSGTRLVGVGNGGRIAVSDDGITWTPVAAGTTATLSKVVWTGAEFYVASLDGVMLRSADGLTWRQITAPTSSYMDKLFWTGTFLVVPQPTRWHSSLDGEHWINAPLPTVNEIAAVASSGTRLVAVGREGSILYKDLIGLAINAPASVAPDEQVTLMGEIVGATGIAYAYHWQQLSGESVTLAGGDSATAQFMAPTTAGGGSLAFGLSVVDEDGMLTIARRTLALVNNHPPVGGGTESAGSTGSAPSPSATPSDTPVASGGGGSLDATSLMACIAALLLCMQRRRCAHDA